MDAQTIIAIISCIVAVVSAIIAWRKSKPEIKKLYVEADTEECEATEIITRTAMSLIEPLRKQVDALEVKTAQQEKKIKELEIDNNKIRIWAKQLTIQVIELGGTPVKLADVMFRE